MDYILKYISNILKLTPIQTLLKKCPFKVLWLFTVDLVLEIINLFRL